VYCFVDLWLVLFLLVIALSIFPRFTSSDYPFGIFKLLFWPLYCLSFDLCLLITLLVPSNFSFDHCIVCLSIYVFWLPFWYLQTFILTIVLSVFRFMSSDYPFGIFKLLFWPLYCLSFDLRLLITLLVPSNFSFDHCIVCLSIYVFWLPFWYLQTFLLTIALSVLLRFTSSDYPFGTFKQTLLWYLHFYNTLFDSLNLLK
jgi:hypothetical protein